MATQDSNVLQAAPVAASASVPVASRSSPELQYELETMVSDIAVVRRIIKRLAAVQEQMGLYIVTLQYRRSLSLRPSTFRRANICQILCTQKLWCTQAPRLSPDLGLGIVIGIAKSAHGADETMFGQQVAIGLRGVLRTAIRVVDATLRRPPYSDSCFQRGDGNPRIVERLIASRLGGATRHQELPPDRRSPLRSRCM